MIPSALNPGFSVIDPESPDDEYLFTLTPHAAALPQDEAIDNALTELGADLGGTAYGLPN